MSPVNFQRWFLYESNFFQRICKLRILSHLKNIRHEAKVILMETLEEIMTQLKHICIQPTKLHLFLIFSPIYTLEIIYK